MSVLGNVVTVGGGSGGSGAGDVWALISVTYPSGSTCTATNGITTLAAADTSGQVVLGIPEPASTPETWTVSCTDGTKSSNTTVSIDAYGKTEFVELRYPSVYGATWDGTSTTTWTRTDASANFTDPVSFMTGTQNYGSPFDNLYPWKDMTIVEDTDAGTMVKIPKFWYKLTQNGSVITVQIADYAETGYATCPACMDRGDGKGERDYVLVGRYHCAESTYKSTTGVKPLANLTRPQFRSGIQALGSGIYMMDFATLFTIWLLYIVEYANWNSQLVIGYGNGDGSSTGNMGYTDAMQSAYHTGTRNTSRTVYGLDTQYRNIEGLWDNVYDWIDGCYNNSNGLNIVLNPSKFSDSANGVNVGKPSSGYSSAFSVKNVSNTFPLFLPTNSSGSGTTYLCDKWLYSTSGSCLCSGGRYTKGTEYGLFGLAYATASGKAATIGSRLMKLP